MSVSVKQAVPFLGVIDMESSLRFYVDGLGFTIKRQWVPERDEHYPSKGKICWCWLELGEAAIMLQEFPPQRRPSEPLGTDPIHPDAPQINPTYLLGRVLSGVSRYITE